MDIAINLMTILAIGLVALVAWTWMNSGDPAVRPPRLPGILGGGPRRNPLLPVLSRIGKLVPQSSKLAAQTAEQTIYPGSAVKQQEFRGIRVVSTIALAVGAFVFTTGFFEAVDPLWVIGGGVAGFVIPSLWLKSRIAKWRGAVVRSLPEVSDLLSLCVGAGLDFLGALQKVVYVKGAKRDPLVQELSVVINEIKLGKRKVDALKAMAKRINIMEVSSFVRTIAQGDRMGTPLVEVLAIHSEDMRMHRFMLAERQALKAPVKTLFPLIFFIMPCVALVVGGPVFIRFMQDSPFGR